MAFVYLITNNVTNKKYVGVTSITVESRWKEHLHTIYKKNKINYPLYKDIIKYGKNNFTITCLEEVDENIKYEKELYWILKYDSVNNGYNTKYSRNYYTQEFFEKILILAKGGKTCNEISKIMKCDHNTVVNYLKFCKFNYLENTKKYIKTKSKRYKMFSLDGNFIREFDSGHDAARFICESQNKSILNIDGICGHIGAVAKGKGKTAYGYMWKFG